jgi:predicted small secreted protein
MLIRTNFKMKKTPLIVISLLTASLSACNRGNDLDVSAGVGVNIVRSGCPAVAVPDGTGDITLFNPVGSQDASAIDVVATMTKLRPVCNSTGDKIYTETPFDVQASRRDTRGTRTVTLPYFSTVVQGGSAVVAKRIGQITVQFADGQSKASAMGKAASYVDSSAAQLPEDIVQKITKKRKPGDADAALDPLADPEVKAAVVRSSFELLIGFQLTEDQLRYNVTR